MLFLALALWMAATLLVAIPASLLLRRFDVEEEEVDDAELAEAIDRHPCRRTRAA